MKSSKSKMCEVCEARGVNCRCKICGQELDHKNMITIPPAKVLGDINYIYLCPNCDTSLSEYYYDQAKNLKILETLELIDQNIELLEKHTNKTDEFYLKELKFITSALKTYKKSIK